MSDADKVSLTQQLAALELRTGRQVVVATVPSLQGYPIEDFGYRLGRAWGIGSEENDDGVLLLVAPNERQVSIEVGYGLEPVLTDTLASTIVQGAIIPNFRDGDYPGGIQAGVKGIASQLELRPEEARKRVAEADALARGHHVSRLEHHVVGPGLDGHEELGHDQLGVLPALDLLREELEGLLEEGSVPAVD